MKQCADISQLLDLDLIQKAEHGSVLYLYKDQIRIKISIDDGRLKLEKKVLTN